MLPACDMPGYACSSMLISAFVHTFFHTFLHTFLVETPVTFHLLHATFNNCWLISVSSVYVQGVQFSVVVTEGRPDGTGLTMANALSKMKVPCTIVLDSAVAFALEALK